jgi:toxin HigB-1
VILSFADATTRDLYNGVRNARTRGLPTEVVVRARKVLDRLAMAVQVTDLRIPPSHNLHRLKGDLDGLWAVSVTDQWRVIFRWTDAGPTEVRFADYH